MREASEQTTLTEFEANIFPGFAKIWACATLIHQLAFTFWAEAWPGWVLVITAIAVLFQPACLYRFSWLIIASLINLFHKLPFVPNHILFEGMLHGIMLLALVHYIVKYDGVGFLKDSFSRGWKSKFLIGIVVIKSLYHILPFIPKNYIFGAISTGLLVIAISVSLFGRGPVRTGERFIAGCAPVIRTAVVMMYFWAAFQKLNLDYLNPDFSCAAVLHTEIGKYFGPLIPTAKWALYCAIWGSLMLEMGIPILLMIRKTRLIGVFAAVWFHLWLSIHPAAGIFSFTSLILAILYLFLPVGMWRELMGLFERQLTWVGFGKVDRGKKIMIIFVMLFFFAILALQITLYLTRERSYAVFHVANRLGFIAFASWALWIGCCYLWAAWKGYKQENFFPNKAKLNFVWLGLILVVFNGISPWIGGKTQTSFSMYSNLRTEGKGNHTVLSRVDLLPFQKELVRIISSEPNILDPSNSPKNIGNFANLGHKVLPYFEFRRIITTSNVEDFEIIYQQGGEEKRVARIDGVISGDPQLVEPIPLLLRKTLWFRRLNALQGPMPCTH